MAVGCVQRYSRPIRNSVHPLRVPGYWVAVVAWGTMRILQRNPALTRHIATLASTVVSTPTFSAINPPRVIPATVARARVIPKMVLA